MLDDAHRRRLDPMQTILIERTEKALARTLAPSPVEDALVEDHSLDAHFTCYQFPGEAEWPRLTKQALVDHPQLVAGISFWGAALDIDTPDHVEASAEWLQGLETRMEHAAIVPSYTYRTKHGSRALFLYDEALTDPQDHEAVTRGLIKRFHDAGIPEADSACADWTRLFRCPTTPHFQAPVYGEGTPYVTMLAPRVTKEHVSYRQLDKPRPTPEDVEKARRRIQATGWEKRFRASSKGREYEEIVWNQAPLTFFGNSHNVTLQRIVGSACAMALRPNYSQGASAEAIYALLVDPVQKAYLAERSGRDGPAELWKAVCNYWPKEKAKADRAQQEREANTPESRTLQDQILDGVKAWNPSATWDWVRRRLVVSSPVKGRVHLMQPDGTYSEGIIEEGLTWLIQKTGMEAVIPLSYVDAKGTPKHKSVKAIKEEFGHWVARVVVDPSKQVRHLVDDKTLSVSHWRRSNMEPAYDAACAAYLRNLSGDEGEETLIKWLAMALSFETGMPIPALSIVGKPGIGKGLLAKALVGTVRPQGDPATGSDFGRWNDALTRSPWIVIDETWGSAQNIDGTFRSLVAGDAVTIQERYKPSATIRFPFRFVLLANNDEVVKKIYRHNMTVHDREALAERIIHFDRSDAPALEDLRINTAGWVEDPAWTLSRHLLWIHQEHGITQGDRSRRFLMQGNLGILEQSSSVNAWTVKMAREIYLEIGKDPGVARVEDGLWASSAWLRSSFDWTRARLSMRRTMRSIASPKTRKARGWLIPEKTAEALLKDADIVLPSYEGETP